MLRRFQQAGHHPFALAGGATGMVGDPGGRSEERNLLDEDTLRAQRRRPSRPRSRGVARPRAASGRWSTTADWTATSPLLEFLRDVGKHVTVNQMLAQESVRARMESEHGISFTEFCYMLLQANDFRWLHEHHGCELQIGGSDQWGNILAGIDLIRRTRGVTAHGLSWPLLTAPDGTKLGKTDRRRGLARPGPHEPVPVPPVLHADRRPPGPPAAGVVHAAARRRDRRARGRARGRRPSGGWPSGRWPAR